MKQIEYKTKSTSANTIYTDIQVEDKNFIKEQLCRYIQAGHIAGELTLPTSKIGRRGDGSQNSVESLACGILDNMENQGQRDFSVEGLNRISAASKIARKALPELFEELVFTEVTSFTKKKPLPAPSTNTLPSNLFG